MAQQRRLTGHRTFAEALLYEALPSTTKSRTPPPTSKSPRPPRPAEFSFLSESHFHFAEPFSSSGVHTPVSPVPRNTTSGASYLSGSPPGLSRHGLQESNIPTPFYSPEYSPAVSSGSRLFPLPLESSENDSGTTVTASASLDVCNVTSTSVSFNGGAPLTRSVSLPSLAPSQPFGLVGIPKSASFPRDLRFADDQRILQKSYREFTLGLSKKRGLSGSIPSFRYLVVSSEASDASTRQDSLFSLGIESHLNCGIGNMDLELEPRRILSSLALQDGERSFDNEDMGTEPDEDSGNGDASFYTAEGGDLTLLLQSSEEVNGFVFGGDVGEFNVVDEGSVADSRTEGELSEDEEKENQPLARSIITPQYDLSPSFDTSVLGDRALRLASPLRAIVDDRSISQILLSQSPFEVQNPSPRSDCHSGSEEEGWDADHSDVALRQRGSPLRSSGGMPSQLVFRTQPIEFMDEGMHFASPLRSAPSPLSVISNRYSALALDSDVDGSEKSSFGSGSPVAVDDSIRNRQTNFSQTNGRVSELGQSTSVVEFGNDILPSTSIGHRALGSVGDEGGSPPSNANYGLDYMEYSAMNAYEGSNTALFDRIRRGRTSDSDLVFASEMAEDTHPTQNVERLAVARRFRRVAQEPPPELYDITEVSASPSISELSSVQDPQLNSGNSHDIEGALQFANHSMWGVTAEEKDINTLSTSTIHAVNFCALFFPGSSNGMDFANTSVLRASTNKRLTTVGRVWDLMPNWNATVPAAATPSKLQLHVEDSRKDADLIGRIVNFGLIHSEKDAQRVDPLPESLPDWTLDDVIRPSAEHSSRTAAIARSPGRGRIRNCTVRRPKAVVEEAGDGGNESNRAMLPAAEPALPQQVINQSANARKGAAPSPPRAVSGHGPPQIRPAHVQGPSNPVVQYRQMLPWEKPLPPRYINQPNYQAYDTGKPPRINPVSKGPNVPFCPELTWAATPNVTVSTSITHKPVSLQPFHAQQPMYHQRMSLAPTPSFGTFHPIHSHPPAQQPSTMYAAPRPFYAAAPSFR